MLQKFKRVFTKSDEVQRLQDNVAQVFDSINTLFQNSTLVTVSFTSGQDTLVAHTLPTPPQGFFITRKTTAVDVFLSSTPSPDPNIIVLKANASTTVTLCFF